MDLASRDEIAENVNSAVAAKDGRFEEILSLSITPFPGPPYHLKFYGSTIHTLFHSVPMDLLESFRLLRVLDADDITVHLVHLCELIHLRYLAIRYSGRISGAISHLQNLQTSIVTGTNQLHKTGDVLPQEIWSMPKLRHLLVCGTLPDPEGTTSTLENLQTLDCSLSNHKEEILKLTPNLKKLTIITYDRKGQKRLECLHLLESLELRSSYNSGIWRKDDFNFPRMLKKVSLNEVRLCWNEMTAFSSLPNLQVFKVRKDYSSRHSTWKTTEGGFPKLEYLLIEKSNLEHWITESCDFPVLKFLFIHDCWRLSEIPDGIGDIPTLELLQIKGHVKKSLVESAKRIREEQEDLGNDALQVRCITSWYHSRNDGFGSSGPINDS